MSDYIKRDDAIRMVRLQGKNAQFDGMAQDVAPIRHGHWDRQKNKQVCSLCGAEWYYHENDVDMFGFCPNCGAKMDEEVD